MNNTDGSNLTASAIIETIEAIEADSAVLYENLASAFPEAKEKFSKYAKENSKNKTLLVRTYQETISDALEAMFSFEGLDLESVRFDPVVSQDANLSSEADRAADIEEKTTAFYDRVAEQAESLLATIPRVISRVAKKRRARIEELRAMG